MSRTLIAALAVFTLLIPNIAKAADWYLAETQNFRLYSYGDEEDAREFAIEMERLDQALRIISLIGPAQEMPDAHDKVTVFRFGTTSDMGDLVGRRSVGGFFIPRAGQPVAFVPRRNDNARGLGQNNRRFGLDPRGTLFHEYTHYFMNFHAPAAYPSWYSEGFAELFFTIDFEEDRFTIGQPPEAREYALREMEIETRKMFDPPPPMGGRAGAIESERIYGHGWLLTSYLTFEPSRRGQGREYLVLINQGRDSLEVAEEVFGDLTAFDREVDRYRQSNAHIMRIPYLFEEEPEVTVRRLTDGEVAVMDLVTRSKVGVSEEQAQAQVGDARSAVAQYPSSIPVLLAAMEVEFDAGNLDEAEALVDRALEIDPNAIRAAIYRADITMRRAAENAELYELARSQYIAANNIVPNHPEALFGYYRSFILNDERPTDNAALALEQAYFEAPFDFGIRQALAHLLMTEDRDEEAFAIMSPVVNNPHNGFGRVLRPLIESEEEEDREELMSLIQPRPYGYEPPEDEEGEDGDGGES